MAYQWPAETDFALWELDVLDRDSPACGRMMDICDHRSRRLHPLAGTPGMKRGKSPVTRSLPYSTPERRIWPSPPHVRTAFASSILRKPHLEPLYGQHIAVSQSKPREYPVAHVTARAPSPTANATRLVEPLRTSPAAMTPGHVVSTVQGSRSVRGQRSERAASAPVRMKPLESTAMLWGIQSVWGCAR